MLLLEADQGSIAVITTCLVKKQIYREPDEAVESRAAGSFTLLFSKPELPGFPTLIVVRAGVEQPASTV